MFFLAPYLYIDQKVLFICMSAYVIHQYVYCISKNLINKCRRFWWINFQRMMLLQWQGHKKKKRKGRSSWIPRWLAEIQRTILVNWDKDLRVYDFCFWFCTYLNNTWINNRIWFETYSVPRLVRHLILLQTHKCSLLIMGLHIFEIKLC